MKTIDEFLYELRQLNVKLWLDGDHLRYRAAKATLTPDLLAQLKERKAEILTFLRQASTAASSNLPPILPATRDKNLPLSFGQQHLWFLHQFEPDSSAYNMPVVIRLTGVLNVEALEQSLVEIVRRHEILRTTFPLVNGQPSQVISPNISLKLPIIDLREIPLERREDEAHLRATKEARQPFDLIRGPVLRVKLLRLSAAEHLLVWNMHCIVCDGSSADLFYRELTTLYAAISVGKPSPLPELPIQYADFASWQRQWLQGEVLESQLDYWKQRLGSNLPILQLPTDHLRPSIQTYRGDRCPLLLSKTLHNALITLSQRLGTTLFMTLLAAFKTLLYRYSGQEDILVSFVNAGRNQVETEKIMGFFSNTLLLRTSLGGNLSFRDVLSQVREGALEAYAHQNLPFEKLVEELGPQPNQSRSPLFQVKFALNPPWTNGRGMSSVQLPELNVESLFGYIYHGMTKFDLILVMREQENGLGAVFDYNADIFDTTTIARMAGHFQTLLEGIVANPDKHLCDLPVLTAVEQHQLLME
ncbi:MAG: non-ribosomal peptide synthetase, partial [Chroococcidiopsidaceae cyanobacterium CP_BM_RX_35]|nr:non-ribosomal peptide synthetase [Chroococcidiopsidaceae cyanobacterium CP_BM_RX_35]